MGISLKDTSWDHIIKFNREEEIRRVQNGERPRFKEQKFLTVNIRSTPEFDKELQASIDAKYDEHGNEKVHTDRGRRRVERRR